MDTLAVCLLAFFATGYFVLAGADIGTGMVLPYLGGSDGERRLVIASATPPPTARGRPAFLCPESVVRCPE
ncbi:cytochrome d ubiquinol oxidase subunit II [Streptomyces rubiginosohelvolus]|uniref:cytochrome d ubiquinol oxidase subunit II n=1 Tax=Streptomyces rubiginosohelvolus TaxID=67362 RepID=UPI0033EE4962